MKEMQRLQDIETNNTAVTPRSTQTAQPGQQEGAREGGGGGGGGGERVRERERERERERVKWEEDTGQEGSLSLPQ